MNNNLILVNQSTKASAAHASGPSQLDKEERMRHLLSPSLILTPDNTNLYVQDWGRGRPVVFVAAWTFNSDVWGSHISSLTRRGFRCLAIDRRGHGRSSAPCSGYDLNTLANDLACLMDQKDLRDAVLIAHSMGSIEAVRYCATHGTERVSRLILISPTTPYLIQSDDNPDAVPRHLVEAKLDAIAEDFPRWVAENEAPFFTPETIPETRTWIKNMMLGVSLPVALAWRRTIAEADTRNDLGKIVMPTLILHGDADASAPLPITGAKTARLIKNCDLIVYSGAPHGLPITHSKRSIADIMNFIQN